MISAWWLLLLVPFALAGAYFLVVFFFEVATTGFKQDMKPILAGLYRLCFGSGLVIVGLLAYDASDASRRAKEYSFSTNSTLADTRADIRNLARDLQSLRRDLATVGSEPPAEGFGAAPKGERIIPATKETIQEVRDFLAKLDALVNDVESGKIGAHLEGSLWKGEGSITLRRQ